MASATTPDPIFRLEHDHTHLSRLVAELRDALAVIRAGRDDTGERREEFGSVLGGLAAELFDHFAREEEGLFPFIQERLPDMGATIADIERAHDRICGAASRILALLDASSRKGSGSGLAEHDFALVASLFDRFDAEYAAHARNEADFLRSLAPRLDGR
ncbi:MAG: hemerythrin domain-containing protein, partial [Polyangiales bacterium]